MSRFAEFTDEEIKHNLARAQEGRAARRELRERLAQGADPIDALESARADALTRRMRVGEFLGMVPGADPDYIMDMAMVPDCKRISGLGPRQLEDVRAALSALSGWERP